MFLSLKCLSHQKYLVYINTQMLMFNRSYTIFAADLYHITNSRQGIHVLHKQLLSTLIFLNCHKEIIILSLFLKVAREMAETTYSTLYNIEEKGAT